MNDLPLLIVGAGPVGLGAALFLTRQGVKTRVVDQLAAPAQQSKALAVNPRTLEILRPTGVTQRMLEIGLPVRGGRFSNRRGVLGSLSFKGTHPDYPYMLALSQATTERLLSDALAEVGARVERGIKLVRCSTRGDAVEALLQSVDTGRQEVAASPVVLAADGAHSVVRQQLGIDFDGSSFRKEWYLADVPLRTNLEADLVHTFFLEGGRLLFLIRVIDDTHRQAVNPIWRVITNHPEPLSDLVQAEHAGPPLWSSSFHISHRVNSSLSKGGVYFAGDAAHIHSPIGARGMNLGLEDAFIFAELVRVNRLRDYDRLRRPVDRRVVRQVELLSRIASPENWLFRMVRRYLFPNAIKFPAVRKRMLSTVMGLDHELPSFGGSPGSEIGQLMATNAR